MKIIVKAGTTGKRIRVLIQDTTKTAGDGLTSLTSASANLVASYVRENQTSVTSIALSDGTLGTWSSGGFKEVDAALWPGLYEFGVPDGALSAAGTCQLLLKGAANMAVTPIEIQVVAVDLNSANSFMSGVNGLAPPLNWDKMAIDASGRVTVGAIAAGVLNAASLAGDAINAIQAGLATGADATTIKNYVDTLETSAATIQTALGTLQTTDTNIATSLTNLGTAIGILQTAVGAVQTTSNTIAGYTDTLKAGVTTIQGYTDSVESGQAALQTTANNIQGYVDTVEAKLAELKTLVEGLEIPGGEVDFTEVLDAIGALPSAEVIATTLLDLADTIEDGLTLRQSIRGISAALLGIEGVNGYRGVGKNFNRISFVVDSEGRRTGVTLNLI